VTDLVDPLESTHEQPLQIELIGYSQVERYVESVVVRDKRLSRRTSVKRLKDRSLHFEKAALIEKSPDERGGPRPQQKHVTDLRVNGEVGISLAIAKLGIGETAERDGPLGAALSLPPWEWAK
jgi:hypothetical protein